MSNQLFEDLKKEFDIELHDTLKSYCEEIYNVYKETNVGHFEKTIETFIFHLQLKANRLYYNDENLLWCTNDSNIHQIIHENLFRLLNVTVWDNIKTVNYINYVIDYDKLNNYQEVENDDFDILILKHPQVFLTVYNHFNDILSK